ncbi:hypothetical protein [Posidoniimonas polymericola]|nr:hypothetical protein [Posidoniimonas polymericola]
MIAELEAQIADLQERVDELKQRLPGEVTAQPRRRWLRFDTRGLLILLTATSLLLGVVAWWQPPRGASAKRIPVLGPITSGERVTILPPPSDAEILRALEKALPKGRRAPTSNVRIVREKIADFVDPVRVYPMIGPAQQHHAHFKCTVYFGRRFWRRDGAYVVYIDHNHLHMTGELASAP